MRIQKNRILLDENFLPRMVLESTQNYPEKNAITNPIDAAEMMCGCFQLNNEAEEHCYVLCLDTKKKVKGVFELSHGTIDSSIVHPRDVFLRAVLCDSHTILLLHNHPSGDPTPSMGDVTITKQLQEAGKMLQIEVVDHVVVGRDQCCSIVQGGTFCFCAPTSMINKKNLDDYRKEIKDLKKSGSNELSRSGKTQEEVGSER